jgi:spoIIIJ-associated protein
MMLSTKYEELVRVVLDINEYRAKREEGLENLAKRAEQQVLETGHSMELQPMSAAERRIIHKTLSDVNEGDSQQVTTESIGEGRDRRVIIKPVD